MCGTCNDVSDSFLTAPRSRIMTRERQHALAHNMKGASLTAFLALHYWRAHSADITVMRRWSADRRLTAQSLLDNPMLPADSAWADDILSDGYSL